MKDCFCCYSSTIAEIVVWISCWYQRNTLGYGNFRSLLSLTFDISARIPLFSENNIHTYLNVVSKVRWSTSKFSFISSLFLSSGLISWPPGIEHSAVLQAAVVVGKMFGGNDWFHGAVCKKKKHNSSPKYRYNYWTSEKVPVAIAILFCFPGRSSPWFRFPRRVSLPTTIFPGTGRTHRYRPGEGVLRNSA